MSYVLVNNTSSFLKYHEQSLQVEHLFQEKKEQQEHLNKFFFLLDHKNLLFQDLFLLFGTEHQLQRFDRWLIGIDKKNLPRNVYEIFTSYGSRKKNDSNFCIECRMDSEKKIMNQTIIHVESFLFLEKISKYFFTHDSS